MLDTYTAVWVSHSSIKDFLECPRAYFLKNIYRDPKTGHKIKIVNPPLSLGQAVHEVLEIISNIPKENRFDDSLVAKLDNVWMKIRGRRGGFISDEIEQQYKKRAQQILENITKNPGPLKGLAVKIKMDLPHYWLSEEDNIILCGKIDWLEYLPNTNAVHIIDFKTSKRDEDPKSLQLAIYHLLVTNCQDRKVAKVSYWYVERNKEPIKQDLPDLDKSKKGILKIAKDIKLARQLKRFKCPGGEKGCRHCSIYEAIISGDADYIGVDKYSRDVYIIDESILKEKKGSTIL